MTLKTVKVPPNFEPLFAKAEAIVSAYFGRKQEAPEQGTIEIFDSRYVMIRAAALSVEFFQLIEELYGEKNREEAHEFARNLLYDLAHAIGKSDAKNFHAKMGLNDPIDKLSAGPVHFSHTGWAFVDISPESKPSPDNNYFLLYDHPYSFEADAWIESGRLADFPVCVMNAGYSSGWCEESFGMNLVATEILCQAKGDEACRFIMAPPDRIEEHIDRYAQGKPNIARRIAHTSIPDLFSRKKLEDELIGAGDKFKAIYDNSTDIIFIRNMDGSFADCNQTLCDTLGYTKEEIIGKQAGSVLIDEDISRSVEYLDEVKANGRADFEMSFKTKCGKTIPCDVRSRVVDYGEGRKIVCFVRDIEDRKRYEEEIHRKSHDLRQRMKELRCLYEGARHMDDASLSLDEILQKTVELIPSALQTPELASASITLDGKTFVSKGHQDSRYRRSTPIKILDKEVGRIEMFYHLDRPPDQVGCFLHEEEEMLGALAEQISHLKRRRDAEAKLEEQNEFIHSIYESLTHPFYVINANDYRIVLSNSVADESGRSIGKTCYSITHGSDKPCDGDYTCPLTEVKRTKKAVILEHVHKDAKGRNCVHEVHGYPIFDKEGNVVQMIEYLLDITERKRSEARFVSLMQELESKNAQLQEFDKRKSEFVSSVAHELRGPLATIRGGISLVLEGIHGQVNEKQGNALRISKDNIDRLVRIVNNVLDLSKIEAGRIDMVLENVDIRKIINKVVQQNEISIKEKGLELRLSLPDKPVILETDPDLIIQVFTNLLGNARKFTNTGFIEISAKDKDKEIECAVRDTGMGIDEDDIQHLFNKFQQVGNKREGIDKGSGLGLSIAMGIVKLQGGNITVESELGIGSTFRFTLPKVPHCSRETCEV